MINAALKGAAQKAKTTQGDVIELELRFRPFTGETGRGVGSESALHRVKTKLEQLVTESPENWAKIGEVQDTVELFQDGYRKIQSDGKEVVYQKKISDETWRIPLTDSYPIVFNVSIESTVQGVGASNPTGDSRRTRKRSSFVFHRGAVKILRIDLTIVENESKGKITFSYEVEVEILGNFAPFDNKISLDQTKNDIQNVSDILLQYIHDTPVVYDVPTWTDVLSTMNELFTKKVYRGTHSIKDWINKPRSLSWKDLTVSEGEGLIPVSGKGEASYAVTIKTDGRRVLVYFHSSGIYLCMPFTNAFCRITESGIPSLNGSILDAELIEDGTLVEVKEFHVYVFDCLFMAGVDYRDKKLRDRLGAAHAVTNFFRQKEAERITNRERILLLSVKPFFGFSDRDTFYEANRKAHLSNLDAGQNPLFKEDGLVYTDTGAYYLQVSKPCACKSRKTKCEECINFNPSRNLKYKLPSAVTVDFLVERDSSFEMTINTRDYKEEMKGARTAPFIGTKRFPADPKNFRKYIIVDDFLSKVEELKEGQIVEFMWNRDEETWIPIRIRRDRAEPNSTHVAGENWEIIHDPISFGFLVGKVKGTGILKLQRLYHNLVKSTTLDYWANDIVSKLQRSGLKRNPILFDIGSGKGGDVLKWKASEFKVYALEPDETELTELSRRAQQAGISGRVIPIHMKVQNHTRLADLRASGIIEKADLVTSFHSMTLIYESRESVQKFIETVKGQLVHNGVFVCMAMDGKAIARLMGDKKQISIEGIMIQRPSPRQIIVQLTDTKDDRLAGQIEYLVDFDDLITNMEAVGFRLIKDVHLDIHSILNDSELLWSQLTRIIEMRYIGFKTPPAPSKRIVALTDIMKNIQSKENSTGIKSVKIDQIAQIPSNLCFSLRGHNNRNFWTSGVMGGGSCFFHSILWCLNKEYREGGNDFRFNMVFKLRLELAKKFTTKVYSEVNNGHLQEYGGKDSMYSYKSVRDGLADYTHWIGLEFLPFIQDQLNVNVHILWINEGILQFYKFGADTSNIYKKDRNNLLLYWEGRNHFQPFGSSQVGHRSASFVFQSLDNLFAGLW